MAAPPDLTDNRGSEVLKRAAFASGPMPVGNVAKVDAYLAALSPEARAALSKLGAQIRAAAPKAEEGFGYGLPGFYQDGPLFYYGTSKAHLALYGTIPDGFDDALAGYPRSKGTTRFTPGKPLPAALVRRLVKAKIEENQARRAAKKPKAKAAQRPTKVADNQRRP